MMPKNRVVFIIDNDAAVRASLKFSLEIEVFKVRSYPDAGEFLSEAELPGSACVVIDYCLPDAPGLEVLRTLRARGVMIPAILITSNVNPRLRERAASVGAGVVEKPDLGNPLIEAIRAVMCPSVMSKVDVLNNGERHESCRRDDTKHRVDQTQCLDCRNGGADAG